MGRRLVQLIAFCCALPTAVEAGDWITAPSYFTHGQHGQRVQQYTPIGPFYIYVDPSYQRSGYRHTRSSIQFGGSVDHFHVVEEWGRPVRPYEEWRFPYRPYSVPYEGWGPPYAGLNLGYGLGYGPYGPYSPWRQSAPFGFGRQPPTVPYRGYQPWFDDRYPAFDDRAPFRHQPFPQLPP